MKSVIFDFFNLKKYTKKIVVSTVISISPIFAKFNLYMHWSFEKKEFLFTDIFQKFGQVKAKPPV